jgi:hypothetical protein
MPHPLIGHLLITITYHMFNIEASRQKWCNVHTLLEDFLTPMSPLVNDKVRLLKAAKQNTVAANSLATPFQLTYRMYSILPPPLLQEINRLLRQNLGTGGGGKYAYPRYMRDRQIHPQNPINTR